MIGFAPQKRSSGTGYIHMRMVNDSHVQTEAGANVALVLETVNASDLTNIIRKELEDMAGHGPSVFFMFLRYIAGSPCDPIRRLKKRRGEHLPSLIVQ